MEIKRKQMIFDIDTELFKQVKLSALMRNITIKKWMKRAIVDRLKKEDRDDIQEI